MAWRTSKVRSLLETPFSPPTCSGQEHVEAPVLRFFTMFGYELPSSYRPHSESHLPRAQDCKPGVSSISLNLDALERPQARSRRFLLQTSGLDPSTRLIALQAAPSIGFWGLVTQSRGSGPGGPSESCELGRSLQRAG